MKSGHRLAAAMTWLLLPAAPGSAFAHAFLESATPPVGGVVHGAPASVEIRFTASVEPAFSRIAVQDASGARVDTAAAQVVDSDPKRLAVGVGTLRPGVYTVIWHVTATDTHKTEGTFTFTVER